MSSGSAFTRISNATFGRKEISMKGFVIVLSLALAVAVPPAAFRQAVATIQISGVVQDASGAVVPGAVITATQTATGMTRSVSSGADGNYVMTQLPIGPYQIKVEKTGFKTYVQKGIVIQ